MKKSILNIGKALNKAEQTTVLGGRGGCPSGSCHAGWSGGHYSCQPCGDDAPPNE